MSLQSDKINALTSVAVCSFDGALLHIGPMTFITSWPSGQKWGPIYCEVTTMEEPDGAPFDYIVKLPGSGTVSEGVYLDPSVPNAGSRGRNYVGFRRWKGDRGSMGATPIVPHSLATEDLADSEEGSKLSEALFSPSSPGGFCLVGRSGSGKTAFRKRLVSLGYELIEAQEPESHDSQLTLKSLHDVLHSIASLSPGSTFFCDSARAAVSMLPGSTGKGGVSWGLQSFLSSYEAVCKRLSLSGFMILNPQTPSDEAFRAIFDFGAASTSGALWLSGATSSAGMHGPASSIFAGDDGPNLPREEVINFSFKMADVRDVSRSPFNFNVRIAK